jgi:hypothetical protein
MAHSATVLSLLLVLHERFEAMLLSPPGRIVDTYTLALRHSAKVTNS